MIIEIVQMEGDANMDESNQDRGKFERRAEEMRSYREAVKYKDTNWSECFLNWGLDGIEDDLVNQNIDDNMAGNDGDEESEDIPMVSIDNQTRRRIIQSWKNCLIRKVVGKTVGFKCISIKTRESWNPLVRLIFLTWDVIFSLFKFELPDEFKHALMEGPWFVNGHHLAMMRWATDFRSSESAIDRIVVWVRLPELPLEYYDEKILSDVAGKLGKHINIDKTIELVMRGIFARLYIEINIKIYLKPLIKIGPIRQKIEYEGISLICFHCGKIHHKKDNCLTLNCANVSKVVSQNMLDAACKKDNGESCGPWMLVQSRKNRSLANGRGDVGGQKVMNQLIQGGSIQKSIAQQGQESKEGG
ncbi:hypothetical protein MKX01_024356 [Papaver californicum]|nr:hypothetical protein MKX01_024356 [Papaver californicum]